MDEYRTYLNKFNYDEINNNIANITKKLNDIESNKHIIRGLILVLLNNFNNYLNKININNKNDNENLMIELLQLCINLYINLRDKASDPVTTINNINELIPNNKISKILENVIKCFHNIYINHIEIFLSNSVLIYYFAYLIYKCILIYYTYIIYIKHIARVFILKVKNMEESAELQKVEESAELQKLEEPEKVVFDDISNSILGRFTCNYPITKLECMKIEMIYNKIINHFNIDILGERKKILNTISINYIFHKIEHILDVFEIVDDAKKIFIESGVLKDTYIDIKSGLISDDYIKNKEIEKYKINIYKYIIKNYSILKLVNDKVTNDYITIPQYTGICWFASMLTGMCYSDLSKKLINSKIESSIPSYKNNSDELFINIVKNILEVSNNFLRYSEDLSTHCDLFKFFKYELTSYLMTRLNEVKIKKNINGKYTEQDLIFGDNDYYYINNLNIILKESKKKELIGEIEEIEKTDIMGITTNGIYILESLYNILGIEPLFIISNNGSAYKKNIYDIDKIPEIIILNTTSDNEISDLIEEIDISSDIKYNTNDGFTYKGYKYKLDYMLYLTNSKDNVCTKEGCGHCVSSIHYKNEQYYYDSGHARKTLNERGECNDFIRIPCSLIRQDWIKPSDGTDDKKHFYMNECFYREADITLNHINIEYKFDSESSSLFSKEDNIISVYVKVPEGEVPNGEVPEGEVAATSGGGNNTYKSTHKKVNIMNKNKTIIERIVYIDKNKNKFIKFNKKYESLSTFKYNRKNKYYFI